MVNMELNFYQYFTEMAMVSKSQIYLDDEDIAYLKQFPLKDWNRALKLRYNDLIFKCTEMGNLKEDWSDNQTVSISYHGITYQLQVNTRMISLIKKLKSLNYDLTGTNETNNESLYYKPIDITLAHKLIEKLLATMTPNFIEKYKEEYKKHFPTFKIDFNSNKKILLELSYILDPKPNIVYFSPNYLIHKRNDPAPNEESTIDLKRKFDEIKPAILAALDKNFSNMTKYYKNINVLYWKSKYPELRTHVIDYIWNNFKDEKYHNIDYIFKAIYNLLLSKFQNGLISRRNMDSLKERGVDLYSLLNQINPSTKKNWTLKNIQSVLNKYKSHDERANIFKKSMI